MTTDQYNQVLIGLDRALFVFEEGKEQLTETDRKLIDQVAWIRDQVFRVGSGHPFPPASNSAGDPEVTRVPWS